jgi:hypothetical protein
MDAATITTALRAGNTLAIVEAITWDESDWATLSDGSRGFIGRLGVANVGVAPDGGMAVHVHDTEDESHECFAGQLAKLRDLLQLAELAASMPTVGAASVRYV